MSNPRIEQEVEAIAKAHHLSEDGKKTLRETITAKHEARKNGPAFPDSRRQHWGWSGPCDSRTWPGLSKKELIAALFMAGNICSKPGGLDPADVRVAFARADEFLEIAAEVDRE